ncbi:unnamed protein product, partial [Darwinula stevensoni]
MRTPSRNINIFEIGLKAKTGHTPFEAASWDSSISYVPPSLTFIEPHCLIDYGCTQQSRSVNQEPKCHKHVIHADFSPTYAQNGIRKNLPDKENTWEEREVTAILRSSATENAQLLSKIGAQSFALHLQVLCKTSALPFRVSIEKLFDTLSKSRILEDTGTATSESILSCTEFLVAGNGFVHSGSWQFQLLDDLCRWTGTDTHRQRQMPQAANRYEKGKGVLDRTSLTALPHLPTLSINVYPVFTGLGQVTATSMPLRAECLISLHIGPPGPIGRVLLRRTKPLPLTQWSTEWPMLEPKGDKVVPESSR